MLFTGLDIFFVPVKDHQTKEQAQDKLVAYLAGLGGVRRGDRGLDVGCGMGATSVWLARELGS